MKIVKRCKMATIIFTVGIILFVMAVLIFYISLIITDELVEQIEELQNEIIRLIKK